MGMEPNGLKTLFDIAPTSLPETRRKGKRCRTCKHMITHRYSKRHKYCSKQKSNKTSNGLKKIKANDFACIKFYEPE